VEGVWGDRGVGRRSAGAVSALGLGVAIRVPLMGHWTVEQFMARVNKVEGIDLGWRNDLRERYDV
jgi:hypothetical protein